MGHPLPNRVKHGFGERYDELVVTIEAGCPATFGLLAVLDVPSEREAQADPSAVPPLLWSE
jgi:hypothetical protein